MGLTADVHRGVDENGASISGPGGPGGAGVLPKRCGDYHGAMKDKFTLRSLGCVCLALCVGASSATAQDADTGTIPGAVPGAVPGTVPGADTLFLTWFGDPTTSIVAQWLQEGEPLALAEGSTDDVPGFAVPRMDDVTIDGQTGDWSGRGFEARFLAGEDGKVYDPADLSARAKIGWDDRGLLVLIEVRDDVADESDDPKSLWEADAVEVFISTAVGSDQRYQVLVAPGADKERDGPQQWFYDYRRDRAGGDLQAKSACAVAEGGYTVELLLPWSNLGVKPQKDQGVAFQFYVDDRDGGKKTKGVWWHPDRDANERPESMYGLKLTDRPGTASVARAEVKRDGREAELRVYTQAGLGGRAVTAMSGGEVVGEGVLAVADGRAVAAVRLDDPPAGTRWGTIGVHLNGQRVASARPTTWMSVQRPQGVAVVCESYPPPDGAATRPAALSAITTVRPFGVNGMYAHRAAFDGLKPGGEYVLRIGGADATAHRFRTAPATLDGPLVFAEGGDVGTGENVAPLHKIAASWGPMFGLIGGDCAYGNGRTPRRWVQYLRLWRKHMVDPDGRLIPMLCAIGNHEVDGSFGQPREKASLFLALFDGLYPEKSYAAIDFGDYLSLVLLDSGHLNTHGGDQTDWLDAALAQRQDRPHLFTAYHVPAYPSHRSFDGRHSKAARRYWVPLFEKYGVDVSFEHHDHTYKRTYVMTGGEPDPDGVLYMGDGAWGMGPRTITDREEKPYLAKALSSLHVIQVTLDGDQRRFVAVNEKGEVIDRYPE
jgi:Carbohydrate family 9 binding domain-like/Calcineurin-like phosphoesterase